MSWRAPLVVSMLAGAVLVAAAALGLADVGVLMHGYLAAFLLVVGAPVGSLAILMVFHLTGGRWGRGLRSSLEAMLPTVPVAALLFVPIAVGMGRLFPWVHPQSVADMKAAAFKAFYLNPPFFILRAVVFFVVWTLLAVALRRPPGNRESGTVRLMRISGGGLVAWVLTVSFAAVDWLGSLEPEWYSSVLGLYLLISFALTAFCVAALTVMRPGREVDPDLLHDIGNLLLTLVVLHAYLAFSQFLIIWNGDKPHEISWYLPRANTVWAWFYGIFALLHFALPLAVLLVRAVKRRAAALRAVVVTILVARAAECLYWVVPQLDRGQGLAVVWAGTAAVAVGGLWFTSYLWWRRRDLRSGT